MKVLRYGILDKNKKVVEVDNVYDWGRMFEENEERIVNLTIFIGKHGKVRISTVFLGLNHSFFEGPPLWFETMVFGGPLDQEQDRYTTWDEAKAGHEAMVKRAKKASKPWWRFW